MPAAMAVSSGAPPPAAPEVGLRPQFGNAREELPGGGYYEGAFRYGRRDGVGVLAWDPEGLEKYEGQFKDEHMEGTGKKTWPDGSVYQGQWRNGRKHGEGTLEEAPRPGETSGRSYTGQWADGKRHGKGVQVFDSRTRYEGRWENGLQHGTGKYFDRWDTSTKAGTVYEGQWVRGAHHGTGLLRKGNGDREKLTYLHGMLTEQEELPRPGVYAPTAEIEYQPKVQVD